MSMFGKFLENVAKASGEVARGAERQIEAETERAVDRAARQWGKQAAKQATQRAARTVAGFLSPAPEESDSEYYARTGTLREDDWG